ncbi:hypothetical protein O181_063273 [Austropuccinia psidii MF-1]|uniref:Uncharacterized protein n=1 Tax=Austropuccinia psidii MF-1 TaxID=1389203 RepID=A0A9Q3ERB5_9BASI|nr:hypothetical protein [Austropuccinia psidii MF-1]
MEAIERPSSEVVGDLSHPSSPAPRSPDGCGKGRCATSAAWHGWDEKLRDAASERPLVLEPGLMPDRKLALARLSGSARRQKALTNPTISQACSESLISCSIQPGLHDQITAKAVAQIELAQGFSCAVGMGSIIPIVGQASQPLLLRISGEKASSLSIHDFKSSWFLMPFVLVEDSSLEQKTLDLRLSCLLIFSGAQLELERHRFTHQGLIQNIYTSAFCPSSNSSIVITPCPRESIESFTSASSNFSPFRLCYRFRGASSSAELSCCRVINLPFGNYPSSNQAVNSLHVTLEHSTSSSQLRSKQFHQSSHNHRLCSLARPSSADQQAPRSSPATNQPPSASSTVTSFVQDLVSFANPFSGSAFRLSSNTSDFMEDDFFDQNSEESIMDNVTDQGDLPTIANNPRPKFNLDDTFGSASQIYDPLPVQPVASIDDGAAQLNKKITRWLSFTSPKLIHDSPHNPTDCPAYNQTNQRRMMISSPSYLPEIDNDSSEETSLQKSPPHDQSREPHEFGPNISKNSYETSQSFHSFADVINQESGNLFPHSTMRSSNPTQSTHDHFLHHTDSVSSLSLTHLLNQWQKIPPTEPVPLSFVDKLKEALSAFESSHAANSNLSTQKTLRSNISAPSVSGSDPSKKIQDKRKQSSEKVKIPNSLNTPGRVLPLASLDLNPGSSVTFQKLNIPSSVSSLDEVQRLSAPLPIIVKASSNEALESENKLNLNSGDSRHVHRRKNLQAFFGPSFSLNLPEAENPPQYRVNEPSSSDLNARFGRTTSVANDLKKTVRVFKLSREPSASKHQRTLSSECKTNKTTLTDDFHFCQQGIDFPEKSCSNSSVGHDENFVFRRPLKSSMPPSRGHKFLGLRFK